MESEQSWLCCASLWVFILGVTISGMFVVCAAFSCCLAVSRAKRQQCESVAKKCVAETHKIEEVVLEQVKADLSCNGPPDLTLWSQADEFEDSDEQLWIPGTACDEVCGRVSRREQSQSSAPSMSFMGSLFLKGVLVDETPSESPVDVDINILGDDWEVGSEQTLFFGWPVQELDARSFDPDPDAMSPGASGGATWCGFSWRGCLAALDTPERDSFGSPKMFDSVVPTGPEAHEERPPGKLCLSEVDGARFWMGGRLDEMNMAL